MAAKDNGFIKFLNFIFTCILNNIRSLYSFYNILKVLSLFTKKGGIYMILMQWDFSISKKQLKKRKSKGENSLKSITTNKDKI